MHHQLISERFRMVAKRKTREVQGFMLLTARTDKRLGAQLVKSDVDCRRDPGAADGATIV